MRPALPFLFVLASVAVESRAQSSRADSKLLMARADSAWSSGDRTLARTLYAAVLAADSATSRAVFRLAQLDDSDERALALYRRYIVLEPDDPWGHMAEGDLLARMGRIEEALLAYEEAQAIAPAERDVAVGRARLLERAGRPHQAANELVAWTKKHADDGEAWDLLGRARMRAGRPRAAADAFGRADSLGVHGAATRRGAALAASAPSVTPEVMSLGDSDGNRTTGWGGIADVMAGEGLRLAAGAKHQTVRSDLDEVRGIDLEARLTATPSSAVRLNGSAGVTRYDGLRETVAAPGQGQGPPTLPQRRTGSWSAMHASARIRFRAPGSGPSFDLRLEQAPVGFNPQLIQNHVKRSEARATLELPLAAVRLRGIGRFGQLAASGEEANARTSVAGALLLPLGSRLQPSLEYSRTRFQHASAAGYFAPQLAETIEAGAYFESDEAGPLSLAADIGAGRQRVTPHDTVAGAWSPAWRAWAQGAFAMGPGRYWYVELETYDTQFALDGAAASGNWRFLSVRTGLRWSIR